MTVRPFAVILAVVLLGGVAAPAVAQPNPKLKTPAALNETAPAVFKAHFETSAGVFVIEVHRDWAPLGADRFYNLVKNGFFDDCRFFRAIAGFMVQFGINGDPAVSAAWRGANLGIDPVKESNKRGYVTYAMGQSPATRTTQVFVNYGDNARLDQSGFTPFGKVITGMDVLDRLYSAYGEGASQNQGRIQAEGNAYLNKDFPKLDYIKKATIEK